MALRLAAKQTLSFHDEAVRLYVKDQLIKAARLKAEQDALNLKSVSETNADQDKAKLPYLLLLEAALNLSIAKGPVETATGEFVELLGQLVESCPLMRPLCQLLVEALWQELPTSLGHQFASLLVRLRAE